jgi:hypothetical protein
MKNYITPVNILILICLILILLNLKTCNDKNNNIKEKIQLENSIIALNDTIKITRNKYEILANKKTPEMDLDELVNNSNLFKTLSKENQKWLKEISGNRKLISASKIELSLRDSTIAKMSKLIKAPYDSLSKNYCYNKGDKLLFSDTTNKLKWRTELVMSDSLKMKLIYEYDLSVSTTFERQKDKSIVVNYKIDDPKIDIIDIKSFVIPTEIQGKTKLGKWIYKNKKVFNVIGNGIIFSVGVLVGYTITK